MKTVFVALFVFATTIAQAQDIKGIQIGQTLHEAGVAFGQHLMRERGNVPTQDEVMKHLNNFTIAGVESAYGSKIDDMIKMEGDKIAEFMFFFASSYFEVLRITLQQKYPLMQCENTELQNGYGAKFTDTTCTFGNLTLTRYVSDPKVGVLTLTNVAKRAEASRKAAAAAFKDI